MKRIGMIMLLWALVLSNVGVGFAAPVNPAPTTAPAAPAANPGDRDAYFLAPRYATDSASAGTAIATGYKTDDGNVAWLPGDPVTGSLTTIAETLRADYGFAIGAVSTVQFSHATPATFVSHNVSRNNYAAIANEEIFTTTPEVLIGGGHPGFNGGDYRYVGGAPTWAALHAGTTDYTHVVTRTASVDGGAALLAAAADVDLSQGDKLIGVFGGPGNNFDYHLVADAPGAPAFTRGSVENPTLAHATEAALDVLSQDPDGFFVMFEQGDIDWSNHANDFASMVGGVWDLDEAVKAAEQYVAESPAMDWSNTLVIVTSDHSNSYMRLPKTLGKGDLPQQMMAGGRWIYTDGYVTYHSDSHTNELVTLWAHGQAAYLFNDYLGDAPSTVMYPETKIVDNTNVYEVMRRAVAEAGAKYVILFIGDGMNINHEIAASRYLYGADYALTWHMWGQLPNGWGGYCSTWDVTTYNRFATLLGQPPYDPANFDPTVGYDPMTGGAAPYPLEPDNTLVETERNAYFLTPLGSGYGAQPATDSASAGTAMATGYKTDDGNVAWLPGDPAGGALTTIAEWARSEYGFAIGAASTVQFSHATPATFISHNVNRNNYAAIANEEIYTTTPEVLIGGGHPGFNGGDYRYVGGMATWDDLNNGDWPYSHVVTRTADVDGGTALLDAALDVDLSQGDRLIGVFGGAGSNFEYHNVMSSTGAVSITQGSIENPLLADVTEATLSVLNQDADGFFVMFEQGDIDWANHENNFKTMIGGVWDLDEAVKAAEDFVASGANGIDWNNTLVIVTSDHSNSYMRLPEPLGQGELPEQVWNDRDNDGRVDNGEWDYPGGEVRYATTGHTNELVSLRARGAGADLFADYTQGAGGTFVYGGDYLVDNTSIYAVMRRAMAEQGVEHVILFIGDGMNLNHEIAASRYLYGEDMGLSWHGWEELADDAWTGYASTWDVTTYNRYAPVMGAPLFDAENPENNDPMVGYNPLIGGFAPHPAQPDPVLSHGRARDLYLMRAATDSASAGTAIATGYKTDDGNVAWLPGDPVTGSLTTIAEWARSDHGFAIGAVSTVQFSHATPATFMSHNVSRNNYAAIANEEIFITTPEVLIGGGHPGFNGGDYRYVGGAGTWTALNAGTTDYSHVVTRTAGVDGGTALLSAAAAVSLTNGDRLIGVFGGMGSNFEYHTVADAPGAPVVTRGSIENPTLAHATEATLDVLSQDPDGFFVMFEQGDIDWANHANDFASMVGGVWDLDAAVKTAEQVVADSPTMDWSNTLVIVTSDHSNSYLRLWDWMGAGELPRQISAAGTAYGSGWTYPDGEVTYQSGSHTNELVTLWARGAGAEHFADYAGEWYADIAVVDNTRIYAAMHAAIEQGVQHVILFIGDGMNIEHERAASRYLYGVDMGLAWHDWDNPLVGGWGGFASTWDVTTYNRYSGGTPAYDPANFNPLYGYDPDLGGYAAHPLQPAYATLTAAPASLYVEMDANSVMTETLTVTKSGSANVSWMVADGTADWLTASPDSGFIAYDGAVQVNAVFDTTGVQPGFYRTTLTFENPQLDLAVPVVLKVRATGAAPTANEAIALNLLGSYRPNLEGASEIVTYDPENQYLYVTNGISRTLDVLSIANIATVPTPTLVTSLDLSAYGAGVTSVAYSNGMIAAAVPADPKTDNGVVVLIADGTMVSVTVGALPDMLIFTPDGSKLLVANEGEPNDAYDVDPEGSISVIDVTGDISGTTQADVTQLDFTAFNAPAVIDPRIRIYGPNATVAQDLEPEYIAVSGNSMRAWVTLQENNALAVVDLTMTPTITSLVALGTKDWSALTLDASDRDDGINLTNWEVQGFYQPDAIAAYNVGGVCYLVTANEGDARDYEGFSEEARIKDLDLDPALYPAAYADALQANATLGRLKTTTAVAEGDNTLYTLGGRSFSIWNGTTGALVYDSGADFEQITAAQVPDLFNADSGDPEEMDTRSDDKGPEAESVALGVIDGRTYAFIGLERSAGGVMVYDVTNPQAPAFVRYVPGAAGDISPEGLAFIPAAQSPTGNALLVIAHEITGSTTVYEIPGSGTPETGGTIYLPLVLRQSQ
ncbi:MAG TPA: choice-of-anchor I family protein [Anaerolineae bacterium]|nr:choice-of-anchor I family protein [Anaerolineae bacterium]